MNQKRLKVLCAKQGRACLTLEYEDQGDGMGKAVAAVLETELEDGRLIPIEPEDRADGDQLLTNLLEHWQRYNK